MRIEPAILAVLVWTAVGLFQAVPEMLREFYWPAFVGKLIDAWAWALLTPAILLIDRRLTSIQQNVVRFSALQLLLSVPFSIVHACLAGLLQYPIAAIWWNPLRSTEFATYYFLGGWLTYCAFVAILQAFKFYNRLLTSQFELERVEKRLIESRLNALSLQLEPHFLFNTLNAISSEVVANPELAREMIEDLGALLRRSLDCHGSTEITLAQELALLDHYLAIQKLRFGKRLCIQVDVNPAMLSTMVPSMLLQPLVENAIRHGIEARMSGGMIAISARLAGEQLQINVLDDGVGLPPTWMIETSAGLGMRVTRERLDALYSGVGDYGFTVSRRKGGGTDVAIRIPLHRTGAEARGTAA
jgi:signal transduction histidine kinase